MCYTLARDKAATLKTGAGMGILEEIQDALTNEAPIGPILLKFRLLSAKLGGGPLEKWIRYEMEGYPKDAPLPDYRVLGMSFTGYFSGPFQSQIKNAPIPPLLIRKIAGREWEVLHLRESAAAIDAHLAHGTGIHLDLSNLIPIIDGKVYKGYACYSLTSFVSHSSVVELAHAIRSRLLEVTIQIESKIPEARDVAMSGIPKDPEGATQVFYQTIYGTANTTAHGGITSSNITQVSKGDVRSLKESLREAGVAQSEIEELASQITSDPADHEGLNKGVRSWLAARITSGVDSGVSIGTEKLIPLIATLLRQFWGDGP